MKKLFIEKFDIEISKYKGKKFCQAIDLVNDINNPNNYADEEDRQADIDSLKDILEGALCELNSLLSDYSCDFCEDVEAGEDLKGLVDFNTSLNTHKYSGSGVYYYIVSCCRIYEEDEENDTFDIILESEFCKEDFMNLLY